MNTQIRIKMIEEIIKELEAMAVIRGGCDTLPEQTMVDNYTASYIIQNVPTSDINKYAGIYRQLIYSKKEDK